MNDDIHPEFEGYPPDKASLLKAIRREWDALLQVVENLTAEQMVKVGGGGWSAKDNLAHLAAWEQFMLRYHLKGEPPYEVMQLDKATFESLDENGLNAALFERYKNLSPDEALSLLKRSHEQVLNELERAPFDDLMKQHYPDDPEKRPVVAWVIGNTYDHYHEHRLAIEAETRS